MNKKIAFPFLILLAASPLLSAGTSLATQAKTIFAPGVTREKGWYDVNKKSTSSVSLGDFNLCWAAACSNMLQYWQDRYKAAGYTLPPGTPDGIGTKEIYSGKGVYELKIFETYLENWELNGADASIGIPWYFTGKSHNISGNAKPKEGSGGYLSSIWSDVQKVCGEKPVSGVTMYDDGGWSGGVGKSALKLFTDLVCSVLEDGVGSLVISPGSLHSTTLWGAELDENGLLSALYITDSDDSAFSGNQSPLRRYGVTSESASSKLYLSGYDINPKTWITGLYGLTAYPIPEPSAFGLFAGTLMLAFAASRRRRKH